MPNRPCPNYDYSRPGIAMVTVKAAPSSRGLSSRFCTISPESFILTELGRILQAELGTIHDYFPMFKLGQYQIMPDHVHFMAHVVAPFPEGRTLRTVVRGFKQGVKARAGRAVFAEGIHDSLVFDQRQLEAEVAYIRDNVRRYRLLKANPAYFLERHVFPPPPGCHAPLQGIGNPALLRHPRRVAIRISRRVTPEAWARQWEAVEWWLEQGYVFVSPFISEKELWVRDAVLAQGGRVVHVTHAPFGERHKPAGPLFTACSEGRVLELSLAREFPPDTAALSKAICERLNAMAAQLAGCPQLAGCLRARDCPQEVGKRGRSSFLATPRRLLAGAGWAKGAAALF